MHWIRPLLCLFLAIASISARAATTVSTFDVARMDRAFDALESNERLRGSVSVTRDGEVVYSRAFGLRDGRTKNDAATMFRIGSITKVFTAALIYQLIDEKKIALSTPLSIFFPKIPNAQRITIAHLLAHSSGLPNYPSPADYADPKGWLAHPQTKVQMVERFAAMKPGFAPGEKVAYSNANYALLGYIIESVTRSAYEKQLSKRITRPLGLRRTRFGGSVNPAKNEAPSYTFDDGKWTRHSEEDLSISAGAGAIVSTPGDLARFITALFGDRLISRKSVQEMITPLSPALEGAERKGVVVSTLRRGLDKTIYSHLGGIDAFSSNLVYFPEDRVAIAITLNGQNYPMGRLFWLLVEGYYGRLTATPSFDAIKLPPETMNRYTGVYSLAAIGMDITVTRDGEQLRAQATGQDSFAIEAIVAPSERFDVLFWDRSGILIEFRCGADDSCSSMTLHQGRGVTNFVRKPKEQPHG
ncbi:MAG: serine hydrolase [Acidobacteriota bacterium]|nr:serine hydrolase [Acidobacteriota bacterium]